ncbi:PPE family protein [Mycobacterium kansasii 732]|uniref:Putative PPE family protein PPE32 n=1 Tax=Mycobacterium pseudokansasii TaxID=2341080 RepID=A0A498R1Y7_9MYCO|nr:MULTISPECIES: PPE family protein [Mycobacterium]EUA06129.1 PPE family protein [Mycobacterium kansasii 732]MBY0391463.1 PPE family protein [Mycobacterium pseudokansasii]ORC11549.1 PPE family protein [Mycobacterium kansasii]POX89150.1 PPE family protein [Mycobacterium kansasii]VAZ69841.1 putative PPE family protein PPE32 [Mycobacterium kansasii]
MDFGLLCPEVNSGRMYAGPGPESMLAAAAAWDVLAVELSAVAVSYGSVVSALILEPWMGSAAAAMAAAATPYVGWLAATAAQVKETASQAKMAAAAFATAFAMTVPPPLIAANRSRLMSLVAANVLGQNSPAIAATQAEYAEMWAQDAAAMYSYQAASASAAALTPFTEPSNAPTRPGRTAEAAAVAQATGAAATNTPTTLAKLFPGALGDSLSALTTAADPLTSGLLGIATSLNPQLTTAAAVTIPTPIGELDVIALYIAAVATSSMALSLTNTLRPWSYYGADGHGGGSNPTHGGAVGSTRSENATGWGPFGGTASVTVGVGHAALVGSLSVPHGWTMAAPEIQLAVEAMRSTGASSGVDAIALNGMPAGLLSGMALASWAARGTIGGGGSRSSTTAAQQQDGREPPVVVIREHDRTR